MQSKLGSNVGIAIPPKRNAAGRRNPGLTEAAEGGWRQKKLAKARSTIWRGRTPIRRAKLASEDRETTYPETGSTKAVDWEAKEHDERSVIQGNGPHQALRAMVDLVIEGTDRRRTQTGTLQNSGGPMVSKGEH